MSNSEEVVVENQTESEPAEQVEKQTYDQIVVDFTNPSNNTKIPNVITEKKPRNKATSRKTADRSPPTPEVAKEEKPVEEEVKKKSPARKKKEAITEAVVEPPPVQEPPPAIEPEPKKKPSPRKKKEPAAQIVENKAEPVPVIRQAAYELPQAPDFSQYVEAIKQHQAASVQRKQMKYRSLISQAIN